MVLQVKPLVMLKFLSSKAVVHLRYTPLQEKVFIKSHPIYLSLCCELPEPLCICHSDLLRGCDLAGRVCHGWLWILKLLVTENHKCVQGADFKPLWSVCLQKVWVFNLFVSFSAVSRCFEAEAAATNTRFTGSRATAAWRPHRAWLAQTNVSFAGGKTLKLYFGIGALFCSVPVPFLKPRAVLPVCPVDLETGEGRVWKGGALLSLPDCTPKSCGACGLRW